MVTHNASITKITSNLKSFLLIQGTVPDMINDLEDTVHFIQSSDIIGSSVDTDKIIFIGHSAGAHLASQLVIDLVNRGNTEQCSVGQECKTNADFEQNDEGQGDPQNESRKHIDESHTTLPEHETLNVTHSHRLLHSIRGVVGIGGPYHIMDHYHHEAWRGVEDLSPMWKAMLGLENFDRFSPTFTVQKLNTADAAKYVIYGGKSAVTLLFEIISICSHGLFTCS